MKSTPILLPKTQKLLVALGENIQLARLRRRMSTVELAERAGISRKTVYHIEQGHPGVAMGHYMQVLFILGLEHGMAQVAAEDVLGRKLQDLGIATKKRAPRKKHDV
jgi:transcriptional regulator with XRE-family HTH domain